MGRKLFDLDLNATPALDKRVAIGKSGDLSENMTMTQLADFITQNLDVYTQAEIDDFFTNYLSKTNLSAYTPTLDTHPATKKYTDEAADGTVNNGLEQGWVKLGNGMRLQWFKFVSNTDNPQVVNIPYPFPTACVSVTFDISIFGGNQVLKTASTITVDRNNSVDADRTVYVQLIGY